jgi:hypothetical protein
MLPQMEGFHLTTVYFHPVNQLHAFIDRLGSELGMSSIFEVLHNVLIWDPNLVIFLVHRKIGDVFVHPFNGIHVTAEFIQGQVRVGYFAESCKKSDSETVLLEI